MSQYQKQKLNVTIYGQQYTVVGNESISHMRTVGMLVDEKMREINSKNPSLDTTKLAVLTAVNTMHDYIKLQEELRQLKLKIGKD